MNKEILFYYDLCGFRDYVMKNGTESAFQLYASYLTGISFSNELEKNKFDILVLSDTILVQTKSRLPGKLHNAVVVAQREAFGLWHRFIGGAPGILPIKGAIGYDEQLFGHHDVTTQAFNREPITARNIQLIVGKTIVNCYQWEKAQHWYCVSICPVYLADIERDFPTEFDQLVHNKYLIEYDIPLKRGRTERGFVINSYYYWHPESLLKTIHGLITSEGDDAIREKYENTLKFF